MSLSSILSASRARALVLAAFSATAIGVAVAPTSANAFPKIPCWKLGTCGYNKGWGYGGAALGGFALGAMAASAASANYGYGGACYLARQRTIDVYGNVYLRRVRVCD